MNDQVQKALDGDINAHALTPAERAELNEAQSDVDAVLRAIPVEPLPDLAPAVLARIRSEAQKVRAGGREMLPTPSIARRENLSSWMWRPRSMTLTWRPAYALAASLLFVAALATASLRPHPAVVAPAAGQVFTQFVLTAPQAKGVAVAGDFSGWKPAYTMTRSEAGVWTVVVPLDPGVHDYAFVVDGERWLPDPAAPAVNDGFGGVNSRLTVLSPERRS